MKTRLTWLVIAVFAALYVSECCMRLNSGF